MSFVSPQVLRGLVATAALAYSGIASEVATAGELTYRSDPASGPTQLVYTAAAGEDNTFYAAYRSSDSMFFLGESGTTPLLYPAACSRVVPGSGSYATCPPKNVTQVEIDLGDGNDTGASGFPEPMRVPTIIRGGPGNDTIGSNNRGVKDVYDGGAGDDHLSGGWGSDTFIGGEGDDTIDATVHEAEAAAVGDDDVSCGPGYDTVRADAFDKVASDCEQVTLAAGPGGPLSRSDGRPVGVSIEHGDRFTGSAEVTLSVLAPDPATHLLVSEDGGFSDARRLTVDRSANAYSWRLDRSGAERLPKIVYVRFVGDGLDPTTTVTDDIILDETPPAAVSARVAGRSTRGCPAAAHGSCVRLSVTARDASSGVASVQFARDRRHPWAARAFKRHLSLAQTPRWVRARDRARNLSRWRPVHAGS